MTDIGSSTLERLAGEHSTESVIDLGRIEELGRNSSISLARRLAVDDRLANRRFLSKQRNSKTSKEKKQIYSANTSRSAPKWLIAFLLI